MSAPSAIARLAAHVEPADGGNFRVLGARVEAAALADAIYSQLHCGLPADLRARDRRGSWFAEPRDFVGLLSGANSGHGSWQPGWDVRSMDGGGIVAERLGVAFRVAKGKWRGAGEPRIGDRVAVRIPSEYRQLVPGFFMATGDADDDMDGAAVVRVYWNVSPRGAIELVRDATATLNAARVPVHLKTHADPRNFGRTDSAVLYLRRDRYGDASGAIGAIASRLRAHLREAASVFTRGVAFGVAVAEDPGDGASFGEHRSRLLADIVRSGAWREATTMSGRADTIREALHSQGYDTDALHVNPGSADSYPRLDGSTGDG